MTPVEDTAAPAADAPLVRRGLRALAAAAVVLTVAAVVAAAEGPDGPRPVVLGTAAGLLLVLGGALAFRGRWRSASATSAVLAALVLGTLAVRNALASPHLPTFLVVAGALALLAGFATDERRLTALGTAQWALALGLPPADATPFRHCLVATEFGLPVPQLDGPLLVGLGALAVGTGLRWWKLRLRGARGVESTGLLLVLGLLIAKGTELAGLPLLCGVGDAVDGGWMALALGAGTVAAAYGLWTHDALWAASGAGAVVLAGLLATLLGAGAGWAVVALVPVVAVVAWSEARGIRWPDHPGYRRARPWAGRGHDTGRSGDG